MSRIKQKFHQLLENFWNSPIKTKILLVFIPISLLSILAICSATYKFSAKLLMQRILNEANLRSQLISQDIYQDTRDLIHNEFSIMTGSMSLAGSASLESREKLSTRTRELFSNYEDVSVSYFDVNGHCFLSYGNSHLSDFYTFENPDVQEFLNSSASKVFLDPLTINDKSYVSHIARFAPGSSPLNISYMVVHMDTSRYVPFLQTQADYFNSIVILCNKNNELVQAVNCDADYQILAEGLSNIKTNSYGNYVTIGENGYYLQETKDNNYKWKTLFLIPMKGVQEQLLPVINTTAIILIIFIILIITLFIALSRFLTRPLERITRDLSSDVGKPYQLTKFHAKYNDEIGTLVNAFEKKEHQIEQYIHDLTILEKKYRDAEALAFTSQMNPHLLYNTLSTIIWLIDDDQKNKAIDAIQALSTLIQNSLRQDRELITIQEEINSLKNYISIQQLRYYDRFQYILLIDDELLQYTIPNIVLQPLFENAIYHGIKHRSSMGLIRVIGSLDGDDICIRIEDNGPADKTEIENINLALKDPAAGNLRIGTKNVHLRLRYRYGAPYGLSYQKKGDFTVATIRIPAERDNNDV